MFMRYEMIKSELTTYKPEQDNVLEIPGINFVPHFHFN